MLRTYSVLVTIKFPQGTLSDPNFKDPCSFVNDILTFTLGDKISSSE